MGMHIDSTITKEVQLDVEVNVASVLLFGGDLDFNVIEIPIGNWISSRDHVNVYIEINNTPEDILEDFFTVDDIVEFLKEKGYMVTK